MQAVRVESADAINLENCEISHTGNNGIFITDAENYSIENNVFEDIGFTGVYVQYYANKKGKNVKINKNTFNGMGMSNLYTPACIMVGGEKNVEVANNDCKNNPSTGIHVRGAMENGPDFKGYAYEVRNNRIDKTGLGILNDYGVIKLTALPPKGSRDKFKREHAGCQLATKMNLQFFTTPECTAGFLRKHQFAHAHIYKNLLMEAKPYHNGGNCIYSDVATSKTHFDGNICYGPWKHANAFYHHCGIENESTNNVVYRRAPPTEELEVRPVNRLWYNNIWGGCERQRVITEGIIQEYTNEKNIYLMEDYTGLQFMRFWDTFENVTFKNNIYWSTNMSGTQEKMFRNVDKPSKTVNWKEWKNLRDGTNDPNSLWADPMFVNAKNMNFKLKPGSPAVKLGFKDVSLNWIPALNAQTKRHKNKLQTNANKMKSYLRKNNRMLL